MEGAPGRSDQLDTVFGRVVRQDLHQIRAPFGPGDLVHAAGLRRAGVEEPIAHDIGFVEVSQRDVVDTFAQRSESLIRTAADMRHLSIQTGVGHQNRVFRVTRIGLRQIRRRRRQTPVG